MARILWQKASIENLQNYRSKKQGNWFAHGQLDQQLTKARNARKIPTFSSSIDMSLLTFETLCLLADPFPFFAFVAIFD